MSHHWGYVYALGAALLFGVSATLNKLVLATVHPLIVSAIIYGCAGLVLGAVRFSPLYPLVASSLHLRHESVRLTRRDWVLIVLIAIFGAVLGPLLFLSGLQVASASSASLLLNAEVLFTALLAMLFLRERARPREYVALVLLFLGAVVVTTNLQFGGASMAGSLLIVAGTFCWAVDNTLSKKLSIESDVMKVAALKGLIGSAILLVLAFFLGLPLTIPPLAIPYLLFVGCLSIGASLLLFLSAMRIIGSMRTVAIFATSSLFGVLAAFFLLHETVSFVQLGAGAVMIYAVYLLANK